MRVSNKLTQFTGFMLLLSLSQLATADGIAARTSSLLMEEVTVTAQKREQDMQDVGIAITAFSGDQIDALGWTKSDDVAAQTPGLITSSYNGDSGVSFFVIRGLGQADFNDHQEAPSIIFSDGAYIANTSAASVAMFDMERVEVLKGPQGTLFGRNATGGLVHLLSRKPTKEFESYFEGGYGDYSSTHFEGAVSGSIADNVQGRIAFLKTDADGIFENSLGPDTREEDSFNFRGQLQTETDRLTANLKLEYSNVDDIQSGVYKDVLLPGNGGTTNFWGAVPDSDPHNVDAIDGGNLHKEGWAATTTITYDINDDMDLTFIGNYQDNEKDYFEDSDSTIQVMGSQFIADTEADTTSLELRLHGTTERADWTAGLYYLDIDGDYLTGFQFPDYLGLGLLPRNEFSMETESWAIFGQLEYDFSSKFTGIAGIRYTNDDKDFDLSSECIDTVAGSCAFFGATGITSANGAPTLSDAGRTVLSRSDDDITGKLQLDYHPNDDTLIYAGFNRGMKAGGYSPTSDTLQFVDQLEFSKEVLHAYEMGFKTTLFDGKLRLNGAAFYYDYRDYQAFVFAGLSNLVTNLDAHSYGGELEAVVHPADGWDFLLGLSLLDATVEDVPGAGAGGGKADQDMLLAPDVTVNWMGRKEWYLKGGALVSFQVDGVYVSDQTSNTLNSVGAEIEEYAVWNTRLNYVYNDNLQASIFVNNLLDEDYYTYAFDVSGFFSTAVSYRSYQAPRWIGGRIRWDF